MEYLLAAVRKNSRRIQLEQWLLLTVRTLIVALLVLAMAEPFLERAGFSFIAGTRTLKVFVIDGLIGLMLACPVLAASPDSQTVTAEGVASIDGNPARARRSCSAFSSRALTFPAAR